MKPVAKLTKNDVEILRNKNYGTNGQAVKVTVKEVEEMKKHLQTLFSGAIQMSFAEKIALRNKEY